MQSILMQYVLEFLEKCGIWGLFAASAIEASSLPFPGAAVVLVYGFVLKVTQNTTPWQLISISFVNSLIYVVFSLIPYQIGRKLEAFSKKKFDVKKIEKAQLWFQKYGEWSITLSRPTGFGNYISYISGISKIKTGRFLFFSFLGVFPWNTLLLFMGSMGDLETIQRFLDRSEKWGIYLFTTLIFVIAIGFIIKRIRQKERCEKGKI
jgi:membrane protein DedA with SNARE-associated domain